MTHTHAISHSFIAPCTRRVGLQPQFCRPASATARAVASYCNPGHGLNSQNWSRGGLIVGFASCRSASSKAKALRPASKPTKTPARAKATSVAPTPTRSTATRLSSVSPARAPAARNDDPGARVNPPHETYAPPLTVPDQRPSQGKLSYLWACGRAYGTFYKTGIKNVWHTYKTAKQLRAQASSPSGAAALTRAEWQILRRSRADMRRVPVFGALFLVFGEWLPLLALWLTPVIPEPCRIPKQVHRKQEKLEKKWREADAKAERAGPEGNSSEGLRLHCISTRLGLWPTPASLLSGTPTGSREALRKRLEELKKDDELVERDGGWQALNLEEVRRASAERGFYILGKDVGALRKKLVEWSRVVGKGGWESEEGFRAFERELYGLYWGIGGS